MPQRYTSRRFYSSEASGLIRAGASASPPFCLWYSVFSRGRWRFGRDETAVLQPRIEAEVGEPHTSRGRESESSELSRTAAQCGAPPARTCIPLSGMPHTRTMYARIGFEPLLRRDVFHPQIVAIRNYFVPLRTFPTFSWRLFANNLGYLQSKSKRPGLTPPTLSTPKASLYEQQHTCKQHAPCGHHPPRRLSH